MELIREITEADLGLPIAKPGSFKVRRAARAVVIDPKGHIVIQVMRRWGTYKLPGGGIEPGERIPDALRREIKEETGYAVDIVRPIGMILEYRTKARIFQISYCYLVRAKGVPAPLARTHKEIKGGFEPFVVPSIDAAIAIMRRRVPRDYHAKFMTEREVTYLREAKKLLQRR